MTSSMLLRIDQAYGADMLRSSGSIYANNPESDRAMNRLPSPRHQRRGEGCTVPYPYLA